jgi:hypothetical protein
MAVVFTLFFVFSLIVGIYTVLFLQLALARYMKGKELYWIELNNCFLLENLKTSDINLKLRMNL